MKDGDHELQKSREQSPAAPLSHQHMRLSGTSSSPNAIESSPITTRALGSLSALSESASQTAVSKLWARESDRDLLDDIGTQPEQRGPRVRAGSGGMSVSTISGLPGGGGAMPRGSLARGETSAGEELAEARVLSSLAGVRQAIYGRPVDYVAGFDPIAMPSGSAGMRQAWPWRSTSDMSTLGSASSSGPGGGGFKTSNRSTTGGSCLRIGPTGEGTSRQCRQTASDVQKIGKLPTYMSKWDSKLIGYGSRPPNSSGTPSRTVASAASTTSSAMTSSATTSDSCSSKMSAPVVAMTSSSSILHIGLYKKKATTRPATLETEKQNGGGGGGERRTGQGAGAGAGRSSPSPDSPKAVLTSSAATLHQPRSPTAASSGGSDSTPVAAEEVSVSANEWTATRSPAPTALTTQTQAAEQKPSAPPKAAVTPAIRLPAAPCQRPTLCTSAAFPNANANEARAEICSTNNNKSNKSSTSSCFSTKQQTHAIAIQSIGSIGTDRPKGSASANTPPLVSPSAANAMSANAAGTSASLCDSTLSVRASDRGRNAVRSRVAPVEKAKKRAKHFSKEKELPPVGVALQKEQQSSTSTSSSTSTFKPTAVAPQRTSTNPAGYLAWWRLIGAGVTRTSSVKDVRRDVKDGGREAAGCAGNDYGDCVEDEVRDEGKDDVDGEEARDAVELERRLLGGDVVRASAVVEGRKLSTSSLERRLSSSLSDLATAAPATPAPAPSHTVRLPSTFYASTYSCTVATGGDRKLSRTGANGQTGKPGSARPTTSQLHLNTQQKRDQMLSEMKKVDAHLVASVRQKQALLEALHRRTHCEHQHELSTEGSTLSTSSAVAGPPSPAVTNNQRTSQIPAILITSTMSTISTISTTTTIGSTKPKASATGRVEASAALQRPVVLRLADHMLKQLHGVLSLYQRHLVQPDGSARSNTAAVQIGADIINEINTQLRAFEVHHWFHLREPTHI